MINQKVMSIKRIGSGLIIILLPIIMIIGFGLHPNLLSFEIMTDASEMASEFRGNFQWEFAHFLMLLAAPLIMVVTLSFMKLLNGRGDWFSLIGGTIAIIGATILAADKGAFYLVPSAFNTLPQEEFYNLLPGLQAMIDREGAMVLVWLLPCISIGLIIIAIGLIKNRIVPRWQGVMFIIGLVLLINPDIDIISLAGSIFIFIGCCPTGIKFLKGDFKTED